MVNACIGIPSWLPDNKIDRQQRITRLNNLIKQLGKYFNLPIIFIAQNWKDYSPKYTGKLHIYKEGKLGILKARHLLREKFLELNYNYLIMFDDDAIIESKNNAHILYLKELENHPQGFCFIKGKGSSLYTDYVDSQLNLCAISRYLYEKEPIPNIDPQKSEGFEDRIWSTFLHFKYSSFEFDAPEGIRSVHFKNPEINKLGGEVSSTWSKERLLSWNTLRQNTYDIEDYIAEYKEYPDFDVFLGKKADKDGNNYMQLIGNCSDIGYLGDGRIKGPTDNILTKGIKTVEYLLDNTYLKHIKEDKPVLFERVPSFKGDLTTGYDYEFAQIIHNNPLEEKYVNEVSLRINTFNTFYFCLKRRPNYYFVSCLNMYDIDNTTNLLIGNHFKEIVEYIKERNILEKTIFVQTKTDKVKGTANWWAKNIDSIINYYNLKVVNIHDNQLHNEKSHEQFLYKVGNILSKIDLVVPYVDSSDLKWQELFIKYNPNKQKEIEEINAKNRFRGQGEFFRFFFRAIEKNIPWINKIHLLVQSDSQVPNWINRDKINIVLHSDFIPKKYLPTFNSCTIEMFLWNIPQLSEKFLYLNDDIFILSKLKDVDFFQNNKIKENFIHNNFSGIFGKHCDNCFKLIFGDTAEFTRPDHEIKPYFKSFLKKCYEDNKIKILNSISQFRTEKNYNCYIYSLYQLKIGKTLDSQIVSNCINNFNLSVLNKSNVICINDTCIDNSIYENESLIDYFYSKYMYKSKYETNDYKFKKINNTTKNVKENIEDSALPTLDECLFW